MSNTTHNNNNDDNIKNINSSNNISSSSNAKTTGTQACAACKYQRRKCASDCLLAPYFPHHLHHEFLNAHRLFGVSNITKIIRHLPQHQKDEAMHTIRIESNVRAADPVGGSCRIIRNFQRQIEFACTELDLVLQQLAVYRAAAAADTASLICDLDPQAQPRVEPEDVIVHCDGMINNVIEDHESSANKASDEALSPIREQTQQQHDCRHVDENNEKDDVRIEEYLLEGDDVINDESNNGILSLQDIETSWDIHNELAYCLQDKEGFVVNECEDLKPGVVDVGCERLGLKYCDDEPHIFEHSDEGISNGNKAIAKEETASSISKYENLTLREDFVSIENAESYDFRTAAT